MGTRLVNNLSKALWDSDLIASRISLALSEFFWAVMLLWPGDTFTRPTYALMHKAANEEVWGILFLASAVTQMSIVLMDDMHSRFARYFAGWNAALWTYVVTSMLISVQPPPAAIGGEIALALIAVWIWARPNILAHGMSKQNNENNESNEPTVNNDYVDSNYPDFKESQLQLDRIHRDIQLLQEKEK